MCRKPVESQFSIDNLYFYTPFAYELYQCSRGKPSFSIESLFGYSDDFTFHKMPNLEIIEIFLWSQKSQGIQSYK